MCYEVRLKDMVGQAEIFTGPAVVREIPNGIEIQFEQDGHKHVWKIYEKGLLIRSQAEVDVHLTFRENAVTQGHIDTEYGRMDLQIRTKKYRKNENSIEIQYELIQNEQRQFFHFILYKKESTYGIH
ncbi:DUF1934 domain-containing protein [Catenisphaera adipataccumulans]|jgi:uncharacterized beta-barrel protein YwiB (DUF1934 family)|uniref:Uncharacterized beta-barrel protein YwiB (DUF1934 family) n=1 Tax=Catenisphaera adipataccumulans TaxID=700500 RepID=A0A7W8D0I6_9FIRM|nr:DUF1934 domain-containing protein [Catenisphaera adipataccumulans]MBB5183858.1 uncharacterized beta-barrel protein YwiB (DUF1934 family) [Catenisphaera adipataccumulans]